MSVASVCSGSFCASGSVSPGIGGTEALNLCGWSGLTCNINEMPEVIELHTTSVTSGSETVLQH